jgi:hypothetical protein
LDQTSHRTASPAATPPNGKFWTFEEVFAAEYLSLHGRCKAIKAPGPGGQKPAVDNNLVGIALSGGGIRSSTLCLGVLQALNAKDILKNVNYLSTVSGGGYIGTATTIAMSTSGGEFPFSKTGEDVGETPETRHLRDNSRYLVQNGIWSVISAIAIYLRGITMNNIVLLPLLLIAAAVVVLLKPNTIQLADTWPWMWKLSEMAQSPGAPIWTKLLAGFSDTAMPMSLIGLLVVIALLILYAIGVSISPIQPLWVRRLIARVAAIILALFGVVVFVELHVVLLRAAFALQSVIKSEMGADTYKQYAQIAHDIYIVMRRAIAVATPLVLAILPFLKSIGDKAASETESGFTGQSKKWISRIVLIVAAAIVPLLLWLAVLQLAYWGIGVCHAGATPAACHSQASFEHAPQFLRLVFDVAAAHFSDFGHKAGAGYIGLAVPFLILWLVLNVNANSLHQLYRDRLGSAFLVKRATSGPGLVAADNFSLSDINTDAAPYHLLNAALNVPGSSYANARGRNADFFIFSKNFVGSEATGYVRTAMAENVNDGLNIGTAMAISGAAAAPNMGTASMRPLSPTIALLNVRLGRWLRHPLNTVEDAGRSGLAKWWKGKPGPWYLLREAFSKSGAHVVDPSTEEPQSSGFVFLTDGGHIENLGIYELLKRKCALIIAVDGEADPDMTSASLVQLERFARIDLGTRIVMDWEPIGTRSLAVSEEVIDRAVEAESGPHVAIGLIDYPGPTPTTREHGVLIYIKSSLSGDENDYVMAYKVAHPSFPHESTMDQLFSEEQFECYRALGEHIASRFLANEDLAELPVGLDPELAEARISLLYRDCRGA